MRKIFKKIQLIIILFFAYGFDAIRVYKGKKRDKGEPLFPIRAKREKKELHKKRIKRNIN